MDSAAGKSNYICTTQTHRKSKEVAQHCNQRLFETYSLVALIWKYSEEKQNAYHHCALFISLKRLYKNILNLSIRVQAPPSVNFYLVC